MISCQSAHVLHDIDLTSDAYSGQSVRLTDTLSAHDQRRAQSERTPALSRRDRLADGGHLRRIDTALESTVCVQ